MLRPRDRQRDLLICGVLSPLMFVAADIIGGFLYSGYSFASQAPSELFAIGAPTRTLVVALWSFSSLLLTAFAVGVWRSSGGRRELHILALLIAANGIDSLLLWYFPMHMRGSSRTFTDTMHLILAVNPFVLITIVWGAVAFRKWFRLYSIATVVILIGFAAVAFSYVPRASANQPTQWLGVTERAAQYTHQLWHAVLAVILLETSRVSRNYSKRDVIVQLANS